MTVCARIVPESHSREQKMKRKEVYSDYGARLEGNVTIWKKL
jgi:hypothetical protein